MYFVDIHLKLLPRLRKPTNCHWNCGPAVELANHSSHHKRSWLHPPALACHRSIFHPAPGHLVSANLCFGCKIGEGTSKSPDFTWKKLQTSLPKSHLLLALGIYRHPKQRSYGVHWGTGKLGDTFKLEKHISTWKQVKMLTTSSVWNQAVSFTSAMSGASEVVY